MKPGKASTTAEYNSLARALENFRPAREQLFKDPYSFHFLRPEYAAVALLGAMPAANKLLRDFIDETWPGVRASSVARTRLIDDYLNAALDDGAGQVVIVGAGYDCRAYRIRGLKKRRVFEVDHPSTLVRKKQVVRRIFGGLPDHVVYAAADFNTRTLEDILTSAGFDFASKTFFLWEGVAHYLSEQAVEAALEFFGRRTAAGSTLVFTYVHRGVIDGSGTFRNTGFIHKTLTEIGETWTYGIYPSEIGALLARHNLDLLEDCGSVDYRTRYMGPGRHTRGFEFYRAACARVKEHVALV